MAVISSLRKQKVKVQGQPQLHTELEASCIMGSCLKKEEEEEEGGEKRRKRTRRKRRKRGRRKRKEEEKEEIIHSKMVA